jgi:hypothetical protein
MSRPREGHANATYARTLEKLIPRTLQKAHSKNIAKLAHKKTV